MFPNYMNDKGLLKERPKFETVLDDNPYIVETAGFVPLDVRFKQMEQAGIQAKFNAEDFTVQDWRDIYFGEDTEIYSTDEIEDVERKLALQRDKYNSILAELQKQNEVYKPQQEKSDEPISDKEEVGD